MVVTEVLWALLALRMFAGGARVGAALRRLPAASADGDGEGFVSVLGPAARPSEDQLRRAAAWADQHDVDVLHLVPERCTVGYAWMAGFVLDRAQRRDDWLEAKEATGWATLIRRDALERSALDVPARLDDGAALIALQKKLARYGRSAVAIAPDAGLQGPDPFTDRAGLEEALNADQALVVGPPMMIGLLLAGPWLAPWAGSVALILYLLQQIVALGRGPLTVPAAALVFSPVIRLPWQIGRWLRCVVAPSRRLRRAEAEALRPVYAELLEGGVERFFDPRRSTCPLCEGGDLRRALSTVDLWQGKPGRFTLDECAGCGHLFQNPRLSLQGLDFYYRDFYDGLGGEDLETLFASSAQPYAERAGAVLAHGQPERWLDVGCGHGHFCARGRELLPDCRFEGLDLSDSVLDAERRGWLDAAHRGLFPDLAEGLAGSFDAVSMSHYLEHTTDPRAEMAAAARVLEPGGHLLIEVPNPESTIGRLLGGWWLPWFQPQHLNILPPALITKELQAAGFDVVLEQLSECHQPLDLLAAVTLMFRRVMPLPDRPWRPPTSTAARVLRPVVGVAGLGIWLLAAATDLLLQPLTRRPGWSNTYRVLARRR